MPSSVGMPSWIDCARKFQAISPPKSQTGKMPGSPLPKSGGSALKMTEKTSV